MQGVGGGLNPSSRGAYEVLFTPTRLAPHLWRADLGCSNNVLATEPLAAQMRYTSYQNI